jgi:cellulose synthase/poly-beta-1,6-N-acetylglucosamine synthase-like glycosyltransferase
MGAGRSARTFPTRRLGEIVSSYPWSVGVVIPAQNEEISIERCIQSVARACDKSPRCGRRWIVVVADSCTDFTVSAARLSLQGRGEVIECAAGSPGTARRLGVTAVMHHFRGEDPQRLWLANTDGDTHVPLNWIQTHLQYADADAGGVAGIVELDQDGLRADVRELYRKTYHVRADGTHPHVHGANLGIRADAYLDVGGWKDLTVSEDHCLWNRLMDRGWSVHSPASSVVMTSGRLNARAIGGFADTLRRELALGE